MESFVFDARISSPVSQCQGASSEPIRLSEVGLWLQKDDDGEAIMPVLEEVEVSISRRRCSDEALAAFERYERVKVYHCEQTEMQYKNGRSW